MIDLNGIEPLDTPLQVEPSNNIFQELGNNTLDFRDCLSELIDNAIAAKHPHRILNMRIELHTNSEGKPENILVRQ